MVGCKPHVSASLSALDALPGKAAIIGVVTAAFTKESVLDFMRFHPAVLLTAHQKCPAYDMWPGMLSETKGKMLAFRKVERFAWSQSSRFVMTIAQRGVARRRVIHPGCSTCDARMPLPKRKEYGVSSMNTNLPMRALGFTAMFAVVVASATSAVAKDEKSDSGVVKGAAKGAAVGAVLPGVSASTGAKAGAVTGGVKKATDKSEKKEEKKD
jgi:hypothetical protein